LEFVAKILRLDNWSPGVHEIAILHEIAAPKFQTPENFHFARDVVDKTKHIQL
jgi:hypothetical protein